MNKFYLTSPSKNEEKSNVRILHSNESFLHSDVNFLHSSVKFLHSYTYTETTTENTNREHRADACARRFKMDFEIVVCYGGSNPIKVPKPPLNF